VIGDNLFRPTDRDLITSGGALRRLTFRGATSTVAAGVQTDGALVPADEAWVITQIYAQMNPGAAQTVVSAVISIIRYGASFNEIHGWTENFSATAALGQIRSIAGANFALMPGEVLRLTGTFNAGVNSNQVLLNYVGFALPRGNLIL